MRTEKDMLVTALNNQADIMTALRVLLAGGSQTQEASHIYHLLGVRVKTTNVVLSEVGLERSMV